MGVSGYNSPDSFVWHTYQTCSGSVFSASEAMDSKVAENRGLKPCGNCCDGEWPHEPEYEDDEETEDDEPPRDVEKWVGKLEGDGTAVKLTNPGWHGPEYVSKSGGDFYRWPIGLDREVKETAEEQVREDFKNPEITAEEVEVSETKLTQHEQFDE